MRDREDVSESSLMPWFECRKCGRVSACSVSDLDAWLAQDTWSDLCYPCWKAAPPAMPVSVRVEPDGRLFRPDGTQVVASGLEPEKVLEGIADAQEGRFQSLADIMARLKTSEPR